MMRLRYALVIALAAATPAPSPCPNAATPDVPQGNYRAYCWYSNDDVYYENGGWGMGLSFDQDIGGGLVPFLR